MDGVRAQGIVRVVVGFDGSDDAAEAVRWAASLTRLTNSTLRVVWAWKIRDVWDTTVAARESGTPSLAEMEVVARQRLTESIAALIGDEVPTSRSTSTRGPTPPASSSTPPPTPTCSWWGPVGAAARPLPSWAR